MSSSKSGYHRNFSFKLDSKTIRRIFFKKKIAANQVFVEAVEVFNSPSTVLDTRFTSELRDVITLCSSKTAHSDSLEILVCLVVSPSVSSALALNQLCYLQQLIYSVDSITGCCTVITVESRNTSLKNLCQDIKIDQDETDSKVDVESLIRLLPIFKTGASIQQINHLIDQHHSLKDIVLNFSCENT